MKKTLLAGVAVLAIAGSTAVYAQHRGFDGHGRHRHHVRMNPEDRAAFMDARIAAVKAGLKLTPDQDRLWPPLEAAVRDFGKLRIASANARMTHSDDRDMRDPVARLRDRADRMGETAAALKTIAEAADPLYKTLDDGQKRRLSVLTRMEGRFGAERQDWSRRMFDREDRSPSGDRDRGPERL